MDPATAAIVLAPMLRSVLRGGVVDGAAKWLQQNEPLVNTVLDAAMGGASKPVTRAAISFLQWLGPKVTVAPHASDLPASPVTASVSVLPLAQAQPLYEALKVAAQISRTEPGRMSEVRNNAVALLPPERRVTIGVSRDRGQEVPLLLLATPNPKAERMAREADPRIQVRVVGQASNADSARVHPPTVPDSEHRPGRSIAHYASTAGSLGAYVQWNDERSGRKVRGFLGASHVMSWIGKAELKDYIHSPGYPDRDNNDRYRYGRLVNARRLVHVADQAASDAYVNDCDVAVAQLTRQCHVRNHVPRPEGDGRLVPVERALDEAELRAYSGDVYLIGRTTPVARGRFLGTNLTEFIVGMPDDREYLFGNGLAAIESADPSAPFSRRGDSGSIVYGFQDDACVALGFVIGAEGGYTYISPASRCLETMEVKLLES